MATAPDVVATDDEHYEVIDGIRRATPRMGSYETSIASVLLATLAASARGHGLGWVVCEMLFQIDEVGKLKRRPDVAFVSYGRWPKGRRPAPADGWTVVPDLAIEIVSPTDSAREIVLKIRDYFRHGVRRAWVVYPVERRVYVYDSPTSSRVLGPGDDLEDGELLPGFRYPLANLFEEAGGDEDEA